MITVPKEGDILVVDDKEADRHILEIVLRQSKLANTVTFFERGRDAIDHMVRVSAQDETLPALLLLDINMPGVNGFDVLTHVRGQASLAGLPVAMVTSSDAQDDRIRAEELGANTFLPKKSGLSEFVRLIDDTFENAC